MKYEILTREVSELRCDALAIGVFEDQVAEVPVFRQLDRALDGLLSRVCEQEEFKGKADQSLVLHSHDRLGYSRIFLLGLGKRESFEVPDTRSYAARAARVATRAGCRHLALALPPIDSSVLERSTQFSVEGVSLGIYRFDRYQDKESRRPPSLERLTLVGSTARIEPERVGPCQLAAGRGQIVQSAVSLARDLVNEPPSTLTPAQLAERAQSLAKEQGLVCKILGPKECEQQKMRLFLAVAKGSAQEARFVHLTYRPRGKERSRRRFVLVGKGITFDSGGLTLKPADSMKDMKTDMAGAATVLAVAWALPQLGCRAEVHLLIPATENMVSGAAYKVGDIYTGLAGKSVEIVNCDAEGRLALADALAYGAKLSPDELIDVATLTGACVVALGPHIAGVMGNDRALVERFLAAAQRAGEEAWPLPLPDRLKEQLKSPVADLKNTGDRWGGAITAALFLREFVGSTPWLHLDIAGPASADKEWGHVPAGGTGFGVAALLEYLLSRDEP